MSRSDDQQQPTTEPRPLAEQDGQPPFKEAWQAQVLAIAFNLIDSGRVTNARWSQRLGAELERARRAGAADDAQTYYQAALSALESILDSDCGLGRDELDARTEAWRQAYLATPHGHPVELRAAAGR